MGYVARDGSGDGKAHYFPRVGAILDHVADANARLSIDPTGKVAGYRVIQDDGPTTYEFQGAGADSDAGVFASGAGTTDPDVNGAYAFNGARYDQIGTGSRLQIVEGAWQFANNTYQGGLIAETYAWQESLWVAVTGTPPAPTVIRDPMTSETNWSLIS